jgi:DNA-binding winged helix-turn-helix (wHTH) protein
MHRPNQPEKFVFGDFDVDVGAYELRRLGRPVRLSRQSMELLLFLIERRGLLVTRSEIVDRLWGKDVFVDVETGINTAISRIRQALRDPADAPALLETVPGKGYRFVALSRRSGRLRAPSRRFFQPNYRRTFPGRSRQSNDRPHASPLWRPSVSGLRLASRRCGMRDAPRGSL